MVSHSRKFLKKSFPSDGAMRNAALAYHKSLVQAMNKFDTLKGQAGGL